MVKGLQEIVTDLPIVSNARAARVSALALCQAGSYCIVDQLELWRKAQGAPLAQSEATGFLHLDLQNFHGGKLKLETYTTIAEEDEKRSQVKVGRRIMLSHYIVQWYHNAN